MFGFAFLTQSFVVFSFFTKLKEKNTLIFTTQLCCDSSDPMLGKFKDFSRPYSGIQGIFKDFWQSRTFQGLTIKYKDLWRLCKPWNKCQSGEKNKWSKYISGILTQTICVLYTQKHVYKRQSQYMCSLIWFAQHSFLRSSFFTQLVIFTRVTSTKPEKLD